MNQNSFRDAAYEPVAIPPITEAKARLPIPVLPDQPEWVEMYWRAWEIAWGNIRRPGADTKLIAPYLDATGEKQLLLWDTAFAVQFGIYGRRAFNFARLLDNFYARQHDDGFICRELNAATGEDLFCPFAPNSTGPNILAWAEWRVYRASGDDARLAQVFWPLLAYHRWLQDNRTWQNGLYWATGVSSGMRNQPRVPDSMSHHRHWSWVDASMQAVLNCAILTEMAARLQQEELAASLTAERASLAQLVNKQMWNLEQNYYQDVDRDGRFSRVKSIAAYWGLVDKEFVPEDRLVPFVQHLRDNWSFNLPHRVPSQAADSEGYNAQSGNYWRGAVWPSTTFMVLKGLRTVGRHKLAHEIAVNHIQNVCDVYRRTDTFWENYAPETAVPGDPSRPNFVGASGVTPIAILLEDVIGLHVDWPLRRVSWDRQLDSAGAYGVLNLPIGPEGTLNLTGDKEKLTIQTDTPFTLHIREDGQLVQAAVSVGVTEIDLT
ncbi:MAG: glycoside hydrolase [Anaerolinea sp.]|nr:glycoside hydrolase [Anaerolinea sp.]